MKSFIVFVAIACAISNVESSVYGAAPLSKLSGPPCPKSVVVGCAPLVQSVPCKGGASYHQGAYSEFYPQYAQAAAPADYSASETGYVPQYVPQYAAPYAAPYIAQY